SSSPRLVSFGAMRLIAPMSSSAPVSVRPNVNSRPVESATQNADQRRLACRTNREPSESATGEAYQLRKADCGMRMTLPSPVSVPAGALQVLQVGVRGGDRFVAAWTVPREDEHVVVVELQLDDAGRRGVEQSCVDPRMVLANAPHADRVAH